MGSKEFDEVMKDAQWSVLNGALDEALDTYAEAESLAASDDDRAHVRASVGGILCRQFRFSDACEALESAISLYGRFVPATTWGNLGFALDNLGKFEAALVAHRRCISGLEAERGATHPHTLRRWADLAFSLVGLGRLDEAESVLESMVESLEVQAERDPLECAKGLSKQGYFLLRSRRDARGALACFDRAETFRDACSLRYKSGKLMRAGFPDDFEAILVVNRAEALAAMGRTEEGESPSKALFA